MSRIKATALLVTLAALILPLEGFSQEQLSLEQAIRIGLEHNYDIRIADRQDDIDANNVTLGNAGFLPTLDARASRTFSENNSRQEFTSGPDRTRNGASSNTLGTSVNLNWTIFDGMAMFINYDRLQAIEKAGKLITRETVENTLADISDAYFEVVRQSKKINALQEAIAISQERVNITKAQYEVGVSAKVEILRAQVDFNADQSVLLQQTETLQNAKIDLNQLLGRNPDENFVATDSIAVDPTISFGGTSNSLLSANPLLQRLQVNREIAMLNIKAIRASRFPRIGFASAYNFTRSEAEPLNEYQAQFNRNTGYNYGLTVSLPIFNGFNINRQAQNAKIALEATTLEYQQEQNRVQADLARAYSRYSNRLQLLQLEEKNLVLAQENAAIALERYRLGLMTAIELREAQQNQLVAQNRLIDIRYDAKVAETELKRLTSSLLKAAQ